MSISEQRIYHLIQLAAHRMRIYADEQCLAAAGITTAQAAALNVISGEPGITQRGVAIALKVRESAMTGMVRRLCEAGLLDRRESGDDSRAWALYLTDKGDVALEKLKEPFDQVNTRLSAAIAGADAKQFAEILTSLATAPEPH